METDAKLWGEDVTVEGYDGTKFVPAMMQNKKGEKIHYEMVTMTKSEVEDYIAKTREENPDIFPETYKVWAGALERPLQFVYHGLKEVEGSESTLFLRRFNAGSLTRFTKNKMDTSKDWFRSSQGALAGTYLTFEEREAVSSDSLQGTEHNPSCLINLKKKTDLNAYFGHADYGCSDSLTKEGTVQKP